MTSTTHTLLAVTPPRSPRHSLSSFSSVPGVAPLTPDSTASYNHSSSTSNPTTPTAGSRPMLCVEQLDGTAQKRNNLSLPSPRHGTAASASSGVGDDSSSSDVGMLELVPSASSSSSSSSQPIGMATPLGHRPSLIRFGSGLRGGTGSAQKTNSTPTQKRTLSGIPLALTAPMSPQQINTATLLAQQSPRASSRSPTNNAITGVSSSPGSPTASGTGDESNDDLRPLPAIAPFESVFSTIAEANDAAERRRLRERQNKSATASRTNSNASDTPDRPSSKPTSTRSSATGIHTGQTTAAGTSSPGNGGGINLILHAHSSPSSPGPHHNHLDVNRISTSLDTPAATNGNDLSPTLPHTPTLHTSESFPRRSSGSSNPTSSSPEFPRFQRGQSSNDDQDPMKIAGYKSEAAAVSAHASVEALIAARNQLANADHTGLALLREKSQQQQQATSSSSLISIEPIPEGAPAISDITPTATPSLNDDAPASSSSAPHTAAPTPGHNSRAPSATFTMPFDRPLRIVPSPSPRKSTAEESPRNWDLRIHEEGDHSRHVSLFGGGGGGSHGGIVGLRVHPAPEPSPPLTPIHRTPSCSSADEHEITPFPAMTPTTMESPPPPPPPYLPDIPHISAITTAGKYQSDPLGSLQSTPVVHDSDTDDLQLQDPKPKKPHSRNGSAGALSSNRSTPSSTRDHSPERARNLSTDGPQYPPVTPMAVRSDPNGSPSGVKEMSGNSSRTGSRRVSRENSVSSTNRADRASIGGKSRRRVMFSENLCEVSEIQPRSLPPPPSPRPFSTTGAITPGFHPIDPSLVLASMSHTSLTPRKSVYKKPSTNHTSHGMNHVVEQALAPGSNAQTLQPFSLHSPFTSPAALLQLQVAQFHDTQYLDSYCTKLTRTGSILIKYNSSGRPMRRWFYVKETGDEIYLCWSEPKESKKKPLWQVNPNGLPKEEGGESISVASSSSSSSKPRHTLLPPFSIGKWKFNQERKRSLMEVSGIHYGPYYSPTFCRFLDKLDGATGKPWLCFSIQFKDRTIDVVASNEHEVTAWFLGLQAQAPQTCYHMTRGMILWQRLIMKFNFFGLDQIKRVFAKRAAVAAAAATVNHSSSAAATATATPAIPDTPTSGTPTLLHSPPIVPMTLAQKRAIYGDQYQE